LRLVENLKNIDKNSKSYLYQISSIWFQKMTDFVEIEFDATDWDIQCLIRTINLFVEEKNWLLATDVLKFALDKFPDYYHFYHLNGIIYNLQGLNIEALACFLDEENAIASDPKEIDEYDIIDNLVSISVCYLNAFQTENALSYLSTCIIKYGEENVYLIAHAFYLRAGIYASYDQFDLHKKDLDRTLEILKLMNTLPYFSDELDLMGQVEKLQEKYY
jgi:tetratricopeptide (TPR) repeat protein